METAFIMICAVLMGLTVLFSRILPRESALIITVFAALDLAIQGWLAWSGFFEDFSATPPHFALVILPNLILLAFFALRPGVGQKLSRTPVFWLVGFQSFRILIEVILYLLVKQGSLPEIMTFTGSNFDLLVGITAPFVALSLLRPDRAKLQLATIWNLIGFAILTNTMVHGILSAPTPFQVFNTNPPNTLIAEFPWVWLPGFVVPCALLAHILSIRQLRAALHSID